MPKRHEFFRKTADFDYVAAANAIVAFLSVQLFLAKGPVPLRHQAISLSKRGQLVRRAWVLVLLWCLVIGVWCFSLLHRQRKCNQRPPALLRLNRRRTAMRFDDTANDCEPKTG